MSQLRRNTLANLVGGNWPSFLGVFLIPFYLKFLGIESYGLVGFFVILQSVTALLDMGISTTLNREMARVSVQQGKAQEQRDMLRTLETVYWSLSLCAGIVIFLMAPVISRHWVNPQSISVTTLQNTFRLIGLAIALQFPSSFYQGGLMGLQQQVLVNAILVVMATLRGVGAVLVLWLISPTIEAFFVWQIVVNGVQACVNMFVLWRSLPASDSRPRFRVRLLRDVWRFSAYVSGNAIVGVLLSQLDKVILIKMLPLENFGYYTLAWSMAAALWAIIVPINNALFPQFVQLFEKNDEAPLAGLFHRASQVMTVALIPTAVVFVLFSKEILLAWTGSQAVAEQTYVLASLLVIGVSLNGISSVPANVAYAFGWPQLVMYVNLGQAIILLPAIVILVPSYGAVGAAVIWVVLNSTYLFVMLPMMFRRYLRTEGRNWYLKDVGIPLGGVVMCGVLLSYLDFISPTTIGRLLHIGAIWLSALIVSIMLTPLIRVWLVDYIFHNNESVIDL